MDPEASLFVLWVEICLEQGGVFFISSTVLVAVANSWRQGLSGEQRTEWLEDLSTTLQMLLIVVEFDHTLPPGYQSFLVNVETKFTQKCRYCAKAAILLQINVSIFESSVKQLLYPL